MGGNHRRNGVVGVGCWFIMISRNKILQKPIPLLEDEGSIRTSPEDYPRGTK